MRFAIPAAIILTLVQSTVTRGATPAVTAMRVPDKGIQPQLVVDSTGAIHLLYFKVGYKPFVPALAIEAGMPQK